MKNYSTSLILACLVFSSVNPVFANSDCAKCKISIKPLDLTRHISERDLIASGQLGGPLSPTGPDVEASQSDKRLFAEAMSAWNHHRYGKAKKLFRKHLNAYPNSPWAAEGVMHLGCESRFNGRYKEAERYFNSLINEYNSRTGDYREIVHKANVRLGMLEFLRGDFDKAISIWNQIISSDPDRRRRDHAKFWVRRAGLYKDNAEYVRRCGAEALENLYVQLKLPQAAENTKTVLAHPYGLTAKDLMDVSSKEQVPLVMMESPKLSELKAPFIVHYSFNHFVTVQGVDPDDGQWIVFDPILNHNIRMTEEQLAEEWSGIVLVPESSIAAPQLASLVPPRIAPEAVVGGCCGIENTNQDEGAPGEKRGGPCEGADGYGLCTWTFSPISMNVYMTDTPLYYQPAIGPAVEFTMSYNSIDADNSLPAFGPKWFFNYHSYVVETPAAGGAGTVTVFMPDGRNDVYSPDGTNGAFFSPARVFNVLTQQGTNQFTLEFPSGGTYTYGPPNGATTVVQALLNSISDRHSNVVTLIYQTNDVSAELKYVVDALNQTSEVFYASSGLITNITDPFGRSMSLVYSNGMSNTFVNAVSDMGGVTSRYSFYETGESEGYVKSVRTANGTTAFEYDYPDGSSVGSWERYTITATYDDGTTEVLYYNAGESSPASTYFTDRSGNQERYKLGLASGFPFQGRVTSLVYPDGEEVFYTYNDSLQKTAVQDEIGESWSYGYNDQGRLTSIDEPNGYSIDFTYRTNGFDLETVVEAGSNTILTLSYNASRDVIAVTNALGLGTQYGYDPNGRLTNSVDPEAISSVFEYGSDNYLSDIQRGGSTLASFQYDAIGRVTNSTGPEGISVAYAYDGLNRLTNVILPGSGNSTYAWSYNADKKTLSQMVDRSGRRVTFGYDDTERLDSITSHNLETTKLRYDGRGLVTNLVDAERRSTDFKYNGRGFLTQKTYPEGDSSSATGDPRNLIAVYTSGRGITTTYGYDESGLLTNIAYSGETNTADVEIYYDNRNRLETLVDGWSSNSYVYDAADRLLQVVEETASGDTQTVVYGYDNLGRLTNFSVQINGASIGDDLVYQYDAIGRVTNVISEATSGHDIDGIRFEYLNAGLLLSRVIYSATNTSGTAEYSYDELGRLTNLAYMVTGSVSAGSWSYAYDARDLVTRRVDPDANSYVYTYDDVGRLLKADSSVAGYPRGFAYDAVGNRKIATKGQGQTRYMVNDNNQLVWVGVSNLVDVSGYVSEPGSDVDVQSEHVGWTQAVTRFISHTQAEFRAEGITIVSSSGGASNRIQARATDVDTNITIDTISVTGVTENAVYTYDGDGNVTSDGHQTFLWDAENRLIRIQYTNSEVARLSYDSSGRLREFQDGSTTTRYVWFGFLLRAELDATNGVKRSYTWGPDLSGVVGAGGGIGGLYALKNHESGVLASCRSDGKGNVWQLLQDDGVVGRGFSYSPYGEILSDSGTFEQPFGYQTKLLFEDSGLGYWGYRWLDTEVGRWLSRDPIQEDGGINLYAYTHNNPINRIDPDGLDDFAVTGTGGGYYSGTYQNVPVANVGRYGYGDVDNLGGGQLEGMLTTVGKGAEYGSAIYGGVGLLRGAGRLGLRALGKACARNADDFFNGTRYSEKVLRQMKQGDYHAFPKSVEGFQGAGRVSNLKGGDGLLRQKLEIPGGYKGQKGTFEFIKESDGAISHRYFNPE